MNQIEIYKSADDKIELRVNLDKETVWLSQKQMAMLFDCSTDNISLHLKNIFKTNELIDSSVTEEFSVTASDGKKRIGAFLFVWFLDKNRHRLRSPAR